MFFCVATHLSIVHCPVLRLFCCLSQLFHLRWFCCARVFDEWSGDAWHNTHCCHCGWFALRVYHCGWFALHVYHCGWSALRVCHCGWSALHVYHCAALHYSRPCASVLSALMKLTVRVDRPQVGRSVPHVCGKDDSVTGGPLVTGGSCADDCLAWMH